MRTVKQSCKATWPCARDHQCHITPSPATPPRPRTCCLIGWRVAVVGRGRAAVTAGADQLSTSRQRRHAQHDQQTQSAGPHGEKGRRHVHKLVRGAGGHNERRPSSRIAINELGSLFLVNRNKGQNMRVFRAAKPVYAHPTASSSVSRDAYLCGHNTKGAPP